MESKKLKIGAIYIRVSTDHQTELSPDAQKRLLLDYAKSRNILIPESNIFQDNGISGRSSKKRPAFQNMIALAKSKDHPIDVIIVWKFSRFARNQEESILYKSLLKKNGVDVVSISEDTTGEFGSLIERIIEWMDEYYSIRLSGEVVRGMTENAMRGKFQSDAPIGYRSPGGQPPVIDEDTKAIPLKAKEMFLSGDTPFRIARELNRLGYRTKRGNLFDSRGVIYILENPFYCGISRWNHAGRGRTLKPSDEVILADGNWKPLWSKEEYEKILERLALIKRPYKQRDSASTKHWLSGMIRCSDCGGTLGYNGGGKRPGFQCWHYSKGQCKTSHYISVDTAVEMITTYFETLPSVEHFEYEVEIATPDNATQIDELENYLAKLSVREKRIKMAYQEGIDSIEEYKSNKQMLADERKRVEDELADLTAVSLPTKDEMDEAMRERIYSLVGTLRDENADDVAKNLALSSVVSKIVFDRANTTMDFYLKLKI